MLKNLLSALPDLDGTGFTEADIQMLDRLIGGDEKSSISDSKPLPSEPKVKIGAWAFIIESEAYKAWKAKMLGALDAKEEEEKIEAKAEAEDKEAEASRAKAYSDPNLGKDCRFAITYVSYVEV